MKKIAVLALLVLVLGTMAAACGGDDGGGATPTPTHTTTSAPTPTTSAPPTPSPTPTATPPQTPTTTPTPLNITMDYFCIKSTHQPAVYWAPNTIQFVAVVEDGRTTKQFTYPSSISGLVLQDFSLQDLEGQRIFQTPSVVDHLKIEVLAYSCEDKSTALAILKAIETYNPNVSTLRQFYESLPQSKQLIGYYEHTWYQADNWGISSQKEYTEANGDLTVWFRIWSSSEPPVIGRPRCVPNVQIQSVTLPSNAKISGPYVFTNYNTTFRLVNNESFDVKVDWQAHSSVTGNDDSGSVTVPHNGYIDVTRGYHYTAAGPITPTYTISYNGTQIDSWSGTMNVASSLPNVKIPSVTLPSNAKISGPYVFTNYNTTFRLVNNESFDVTVYWQAHSSVTGNYDSGSVTVPHNGYIDVTRGYHYTAAGPITLTYTISYNGTQLDSWSGTMNVAP